MPTYDYQCEECGHIFEEIHSMSETYEDGCPKCGHENVNKVYNTAPQINMGEHGGKTYIKRRYNR